MEDYLDKILDIAWSIEPDVVTLLTGRNAGGKSLIRKLLRQTLADKLGKDKVTVAHASQELRTGSYASMGALSGLTRDIDWLATSQNTITTMEQSLKAKADYYVIDEPEIGMGEELQLGLVDWLNEKISFLNKGVLLVCHSRLIAQGIKFDTFINLEGMGYEEWTARVPQKISVEEFQEFSNSLFETVRTRNKKG